MADASGKQTEYLVRWRVVGATSDRLSRIILIENYTTEKDIPHILSVRSDLETTEFEVLKVQAINE